MKFVIHFELADGTEDAIFISGDTISEIREQAEIALERRGGMNPWSEEVTP